MNPVASLLGVVPLLGVVLSLGCGGSSTPPSVAEIDGVQTCKVARDPLNPYVVEWRGAELTNLEHQSKQGLVIVSYGGCTLKVLTGCRAAGSYAFSATTRNRDAVEVKSNDQLYAELPVGAAGLEAHIEQGRELKLDYVAVGAQGSSQAPDRLQGACEGATHYVHTIIVGAFSLGTFTRGQLGAGIENPVGSSGGFAQNSYHVLKRGGDVERCASGEADASYCTAILRLGLAELPGARTERPGSVGFGAGLGGSVEEPAEESEVPEIQGDFRSADVELLERLQLAKRADRNAALAPSEKAVAWKHLLDGAAGNVELATAARKRYQDWLRVVEARRVRRERIEQIGKQYLADKHKLEKLLALDEDVVSVDTKEAYVEEFDQAYLPHAAAIAAFLLDRELREAASRPSLPHPPTATQ